jgi:zinc protease
VFSASRGYARPVPSVTLILFFVLAASGAVAPPAHAGQAPMEPGLQAGMSPDLSSDDNLEPVFHPLPPQLEIRTLENGLQVVLAPNPAQPMVGIYTMVGVGSAWEDFRTSGTSHMLEHLLFNGTEEMTQEQLYELADRLGAYNNANTSDFFTNYMLVLPADSLAAGLHLQSQMLFHSVLPPEKFAKEQGIVLGELVAARDQPGEELERTRREVLYAGSSLELPTLGTRATIANLSRDEVYAFYRNHYVPNNMITLLAGGFDPQEALALLEQSYGSVPPGTVQRPELRPAESLDRTRTVTRRAGDQRVLTLAYAAPAYGSPDFFPFMVLSRLLDAPGTGILTRTLDGLPETERPTLSVWWEKPPGFSRLIVELDLPGDVEPTELYRTLEDGLAAVGERGIKTEDVNEVVSMERTETLLQREQLRHTGIYAAEPLVLGGPDFFATYLSHLQDVTASDVGRMLETYLVGSPVLALLTEPRAGGPAIRAGGQPGMPGGMPPGMKMPPGMTMPPAAKAPAAGDQEGAAPAEEALQPGAPRGKASRAGAATDLPIERSELANGAVLVTRRNPASPLFAIHLTVRNRAEVDDGHPGALNLVHKLLLHGVGGCDEACLARRLRSLGAVVKVVDDPRIPMDDYYTTGRFSYVRIETVPENGPAVLELLAEMTQHASFSADDFAQERREQIDLLAGRQDSAARLASRLFAEALYGQHPLARPPEGTVASLTELTYDEARRIYRQAFAPSNLILAIVSPARHEDLASQLEELLPGRGRPTSGLPPLPLTQKPERVTASLGGEMAAIRMGALLACDPGDREALQLLVAVLSDRLAMELREKRGLSYSVGASLGLHGSEGRFATWLQPPRERLAEGEAALREAVTAFDPASITPQELNTVRSAILGRYRMRLLSGMSQAYYLAMAELSGDLSRFDSLLTGYQGITTNDLVRVHARYLAGLPLVTVVVD